MLHYVEVWSHTSQQYFQQMKHLHKKKKIEQFYLLKALSTFW